MPDQQATENMENADENDNLIENINNYFLKWKTFNYDPLNGNEEPTTTMPHGAKERSQSRLSNSNQQGVHSILTSPEEMYQQTDNKLTFTLPR